MRVVSLLPSATEIMDEIGASDLLVGRSHECDHPASVAGLPALTGQRTDPNASALEIDRQTSQALEQGGSLYTLDADLLAELKPDLILTQDLCDVCSIDLETVRAAAAEMIPRPTVLSLNPETVEEVFDDVIRVGQAVGRDLEARNAAVSLRNRLHAAAEHVNQFADGPIVGFMEWTDPIYIAGHWTVQLIERAGGRHPLNETVPKPGSGAAVGPQQAERVAGKSIAVPHEAFAAVSPEYLIVSPCGFDLARAEAEARRLLEEPWCQALPAVRAGRVAAVDGSQMFNRPGPRLIDAMEWLVGWIQDRPHLIPDDFPWKPIG